LVTVPIMIWLGISPQSAIASARVASIGTMVAGLRQFYKNGKVDFYLAFRASFLGVVGACIGAYLIVYISSYIAEKAIGIVTLFLLFISISRKKTTTNILYKNPNVYLKEFIGYFLFIFAGMLGGFFGGQAIIATYIFSIFFNKSISESVGTRKVNGLLVSFFAILIYGVHNLINWVFSISLILGTLIGSTFGAKYALKKGDKWIENLFNIVVIVLSLNMIF
ncbi:MAG: sulfite exporter TauE/SafE family protein, partial [Rickettsia endosymbiont of Labidopullus appendiculatus]|nr:sulfite exporter TauE/SafE family protein [Rickettsia endosymbiont of Labidopullus appendiculatus]